MCVCADQAFKEIQYSTVFYHKVVSEKNQLKKQVDMSIATKTVVTLGPCMKISELSSYRTLYEHFNANSNSSKVGKEF